MSKLRDIYRGKSIWVWQDGESAYVEFLQNKVTISLPFADLPNLVADFAKVGENLGQIELPN